LCIPAATPLDFGAVASVTIGTNEVQTVAVNGETVWRKLPYDEEIGWIEANTTGGTAQYIDTLCPVETNTVVEARWYQVGNAAQQRLFGLNDGNPSVFACYINNNTKWAANTGSASGTAIGNAPGDKQYQGRFDLGAGYVQINTSKQTIGGTPFASTNTIPIFARKNLGVAKYEDYPATMRLNWFKIWYGDTLVRDFVPVRIGTEGALYDRVSGTLFTNAGTGSFGIP
jgi:hypothetical protein